MAKNNHDNKGYCVGNVWVSPQHNVLARGQNSVNVQPKVMAVLDYLVMNRDRVIDNDELLDNIWKGRVVTHSSIQKSINAMRSAISQLDDSQEYVAHFSKRGYQLVVPVECAKPAALIPRVRSRGLWLALTVVLLIALVTLFYWQMISETQVNAAYNTHIEYSNLEPVITTDIGSEHNPVYEPVSGRLAFVRELKVDGRMQSRLLVSDAAGQEWMVAPAQGQFVDIAWSASGRNLVALDRHDKDGRAELPTFFESQHQYYTFQIFTLDFKGERVLEKNRLSYWLGNVKSVTWQDENTLEFVASQAPQLESRRYHYAIPSQKLTQLNPVAPGSKPLASQVYDGHTALLRMEEDQMFVSLLNNAEVYADWPVPPLRDISWQPDGNGLLLDRVEQENPKLLHLNGDITDLKIPSNLLGSLVSARFGQNQQLMVTLQKSVRDSLIWNHSSAGDKAKAAGVENEIENENIVTVQRTAGETLMEIGTQDGRVISAIVVDDGDVLFAVEKDHRLTIHRIKKSKPQQITSIPLTQTVTSLAWANNGQKILLSLKNTDVMLLDLVTGQLTLLMNSKKNVTIVAYDEGINQLWGISETARVRNLHRVELPSGSSEQLIFGGIADVLPATDGFYFQYFSQSGLWFLDKQSNEVKQVAGSMPINVHLLAVKDNTVYFVSGGQCHESDVYSLNLTTDRVEVSIERTRNGIQTLAFDSQRGALQRLCQPRDLDVMGLSPKK